MGLTQLYIISEQTITLFVAATIITTTTTL